jgi:drug/metabolite transporter (DMT)-like permease
VVGILLGLAAPVLWSTSGMFIKVLQIEPIPLTGLRCAMAGLIFSPLVRSWRMPPGRDMTILIVAYGVLNLTFVTATKWTTAANAIALQATSPAWVFLVSCLVARRVVWRFTVPIAIILAGLAVILMEPVEGISFTGNLLGLVAGFAFATVSIFYARVDRRSSISPPRWCYSCFSLRPSGSASTP